MCEQGMSDEAIKYILAELDYYDSIREGKMQMSAVDGTWQAEAWIADKLLEDLKAGVAKLEDVPESAKDWHPGSKEQVINRQAHNYLP